MINLIERRDMMAPRSVTFDDFVEVEYIENSSYAYIDTKYIPTNNTNIETKLEVTSYKEEWGEWLFGARKDSSNQQFALLLLTASDKKASWTFAKTRASGSTLFNENVAYTISNNKNVLTITDGTNTDTLTATNSTFTSPVSMYIFNLNNNGSLPTSNSALIKLYYFKIYEGQTLVRDFVPVLQVSTRRYGLWDKVEGKFYTSPNGIEFSGMNPMVFDANGNIYWLKNYVQSRGYYSYATTPIKAKSTDLIKMGFTVTSRPSTDYCFLIGYYNSESNRFGIYMRTSSYRWSFDFWRGNNSSSRKHADASIAAPALNKRYDLIVGNPSLTSSTEAYAYDAASDTVLIPSGTTINNTTSSNSYIISENRSGKAGYVTRYYYVKIYKQENGEKVLKFDAIPVQRDSDDVWGFYDKLTNTFYPSNGTEQFTGA